MKKLRFKRKSHGRGWTPSTRQGWLILVIYLILTIGRAKRYGIKAKSDQLLFPNNPDSGGNLLVMLVPIIVLTLLLLIICYRKGETPKWQWGEEKD